ncbi:hypothetical protein J5TS2_36710 [Brevibacillus halotolerans]|uniref:hypothetical protein n=1 Tax=Brevibacillus halotolerans TaxID=1507437 RepID=UPI001B171684|nr:hypothetical protein [Brevibacillus halotolerans]GIO03003.1 hypothetical protein J5TS2_36710 [Brevibacillus halotolerans]
MRRLNIIFLGLGLLLFPAIINYGVLTWRAPGVVGDTSQWLSFLGSYLGLIGAIVIAVYTIQKQKEQTERKEIEDNRSYIVVHDFNAPLKLKNVITNENSRIVETEGYKDLKDRVSSSENVPVSYLKISQFGNPELIINCQIHIDCRVDVSFEKYEINVNLGSFEKGAEIFIPLLPPGLKMGQEVLLDKAVIEYTTLKQERLQLIHDPLNKKETLNLISNNRIDKVLYEFEMNQVEWTYPNRIKQESS